MGILGGTFNPPHLGHIALARAAADQLGLRSVLLVPAGAPPHKPHPQLRDPGAEHRLRMCQLASRADPRLRVSTLELDRPGPSYTVDTLHSIHANHPDGDLFLIMGADMARTLPSWREPQEILRLARLAVAEREGTRREAVLDGLRELDGAARTAFVRMAPVNVSSSAARARIAAGHPVEDLVGGEVAAYIAEQGLYREGAPVSQRSSA